MSDERGGRYFREARFFLAGDKAAAQSHIGEARVLMGYMRDQLALGGPPIQVRYATLQDGTQIKATMMNGQYQAQIISPGGGVQKTTDGYEIWVRPYASPDYDWKVIGDPDSLYGVVTERQDRRHYSNRMWQSPDKSIHCVIGGGDDSKYFGLPGNQISVDGVIVHTGSGIVGTAIFAGKRVIATSSLSYNSGSKYETVTFTVTVDGYSYTTPALSAITYGYLQEGGARRFSQKTVLFNSSGSEGSCVLGDTSVLTFTLTIVDGVVSCSHTITEIPGTDATVAVERAPTGTTGTVTTYAGCSKTVAYVDNYTVHTGQAYVVAFACDYSEDGALVYGLLRYDNRYSFSTASSYSETWTWTACGGPIGTQSFTTSGNRVTSVYQDQYNLTQPGVDCVVVSTLHGDLTRLRRGLETNLNSNGRYGPIVEEGTAHTLDTVAAIDLRHGFVITDGVPPLHYIRTTLITDNGDMSGTSQRTTVYSGRTQYTYTAQVNVGVPVMVDLGVATPSWSVPELPVNISLPYNGVSITCAPCEGYSTSSNITPVVMAPSDPAVPVRTIVRPRIFVPDMLVPTDKVSYGFVYPGESGWSQALAFFQVDDGTPAVYSLHMGGYQDVTDKFIPDTQPPGDPTTKHFGVIHTTA